jgi:hypothetical protein
MPPFRPLIRTMMSVGKALVGCHSRSSTHWGSSALQQHRASLPSLTYTTPHAFSSWRANRQLHHGPVAASAAATGAGDSTPHTFLFTSESVTEVYPGSTGHSCRRGGGVEHVSLHGYNLKCVTLSASVGMLVQCCIVCKGQTGPQVPTTLCTRD